MAEIISLSCRVTMTPCFVTAGVGGHIASFHGENVDAGGLQFWGRDYYIRGLNYSILHRFFNLLSIFN